MIFITGGAYQGKKEYALKKYNIDEKGIAKTIHDLISAKLITDYHMHIRKMMEQDLDPAEMTKRICIENRDAVIIMNEIGCGIIPMEHEDREWRENVGRCGCVIARNAHKVIRFVCGIPTVIKEIT